MKILLVNDYAIPTGGAELVTLRLRDGLKQRGHDARVFASSARPGLGDSYADYECFGTTSRLRTLLQSANPWAFWRFRRVLAEFRPDVVHVGMFLTQLSPLILPLLGGVPSLYNIHWYRPICPLGTKMLPDGTVCQVPPGTICYYSHCLPLRDWFLLMLQIKLWRRWSNVFNMIVADSEALKRRLVKEGIAPVEVVWCGSPVRSPRPPLASPPSVIFVGRFVPEKGADVLIRAFTKVVLRIPTARLFLTGHGPQEEYLKQLVCDLGLSSNVSLTGYLRPSEVESRLAACWVQTVPSLWAEPFGLVATDAMMRGTAVISSRTGGLAEIVQDGVTGLLVPPGNAETLAEAMLRLLCDRELAEQMGEAGREHALAHFSESIVLDRFVALYQTLLRDGENQDED